MSEISKNTESAIPQADTESKKDTIPNHDTFIPVKFNKEVRNLTLEEAGALAQKGLKYDSIEKDYLALKELAAKENKSVPAYINHLNILQSEQKVSDLTDKCGGNSEMAQHILKLESGLEPKDSFAEVKENFPEIKNLEDLPTSVLENSKIKGTLLLDEYLRYLLAQKQTAKSVLMQQKAAQNSSAGSLYNKRGGNSPETEEFLKGLWK